MYMVKPITKETLFMNVMELDFPSKIELEHWLETFQERIWTEDLMAKLSKAGLIISVSIGGLTILATVNAMILVHITLSRTVNNNFLI